MDTPVFEGTRVFEWDCERCGVSNRSSSNLCRQCNFVRVTPALAFDRVGPPMAGRKLNRGTPVGVVPITCQKCGKPPPGNPDRMARGKIDGWILRTLTGTLLDAIVKEDVSIWPELEKVIDDLRPYVGMQVCPICRPLGKGHYHMIANMERDPAEKADEAFQKLVLDARKDVELLLSKYPLASKEEILKIAKTKARSIEEAKLYADEIRDEYPDLTEEEVTGLIRDWSALQKDEAFNYEKEDVRVQNLLHEARPVKFSLMKKHVDGDDILSAIEDIEQRVRKEDKTRQLPRGWLRARYEVNRNRLRLWTKTGRNLRAAYEAARNRYRQAKEIDKANRDVIAVVYDEWKRRQAEMKKSLALTDDPVVQKKIREWAYQAEAAYSRATMELRDLGFGESKMWHGRVRRALQHLRKNRGAIREMRRNAGEALRLLRQYRQLLYELRHIYEIRWSTLKDDLSVEWKVLGNGSPVPAPFGMGFGWTPFKARHFRRHLDEILARRDIDPVKEGWLWMPDGPEIGYHGKEGLKAGMRWSKGAAIMALPWMTKSAFEPWMHNIVSPHEGEEEETVTAANQIPKTMPRWQPIHPTDLRGAGESLAHYIGRKRPNNEPVTTVCSQCNEKITRVPGRKKLPKIYTITARKTKDDPTSPLETLFLCEGCYRKRKKGIEQEETAVVLPKAKAAKAASPLKVEGDFRKEVSLGFIEAEKILRANYQIRHFTPVIRYSRTPLEYELWALVLPHPDVAVRSEALVYKKQYVIRVHTTDTLRWRAAFLWLWLWKDRKKWAHAADRKGYKLGIEGLSQGLYQSYDPSEISRVVGISLPDFNDDQTEKKKTTVGHSYRSKRVLSILLPKEYWRGVYQICGPEKLTWEEMAEHLDPSDPHYAEAQEHADRKEKEEQAAINEAREKDLKREKDWGTYEEKRRHEKPPDPKRVGYELTYGMIGFYKGVRRKDKKSEEEYARSKRHESEANKGACAALHFKSYLNDKLPRRIDETVYQEWLATWIDPARMDSILAASEKASKEVDAERRTLKDKEGKEHEDRLMSRIWDAVILMATREFLGFLRAKGRMIDEETHNNWFESWKAEEMVIIKKKGPAHPK